ncbi:MAG TPA: ABC transporter ATP-binding protein [Gammaproteobacteria bacterium]
MSAEPAALLATRGLAVSIAGRRVCRDLELRLEPGQCWALLGRNGVGKTTLLHTLAGLRRADAGSVELGGAPLAALPRRRVAQQLGVLPQDNRDLFPATVLETALIGRHPHLGGLGWEGPEDLALAHAALAEVGLQGCAARSVTTLSGGERRRLALATLLVQQPRVALLDEPANHLDLRHQVELLALLAARARRDGGALLLVAHDVNLAARCCDHALLLLGDGATRAGRFAAVVDAATLGQLYGHPVVEVAGPHGPAWLPA